jgi:hypothetical protein
MNIDQIYKSNSSFLKAEDLIIDGKATKPVVEIEAAEVRENTYQGETKSQIVLSFVGKEKVLGLNVTNARRIAQLIGPDTDEWAGYRIKLYVDQTQLQTGQVVDCIRIMPDLPEQTNQKAKAAVAASELEDAPF